MPQENIEEATFVGRDVAFQLGYFSGASAAILDFGLNDEALAIIAAGQYMKTCKSIQLDRDLFLDGWIDGWKENRVPIVEVIVILSERSEQHGDCI